jgi:RHH-type proline utilization regulon transcriptional repressor/proline dehydrogenase/delta 1-pyrroline-5-carboxylate dehydrogenase
VRDGFEGQVQALARSIADLEDQHRPGFWAIQDRTYDALLGWAMSHPSFKTQLFRFVDVFPATHDDTDVLRHVREYFEDGDTPRALDMGVGLADHLPGGGTLTASIARRQIKRMAEQFIVGTTATDAVDGLHRLWKRGNGFVVDLLGEKTVTEAEADRYAARMTELLETLLAGAVNWAPDDHLERDDTGVVPRVHVSIKPTALASRYGPLTRADGLEEAKQRLRPILRTAAAGGAFVWFDMEHYDVKDLTLQLFRELLDEPGLGDLDAGCVIQAYLKDSRADLADLIAWSSGRPRPVAVRLVKGAYWDAETIHARAEGWPVPVFEHKPETDANYERCTRLLHDHHGHVRAAFASHNLRSIAYAVTYARSLGLPDTGYEVQMLYGMAEPVQAAIRRLGLRLRVYAPVGELVPGMAYLVRRLLENTSNESFVRQKFTEGRELDALLRPPAVEWLPDREPPARRLPTDPAAPSAYEPEPHGEWRRPEVRAAFAATVRRIGGEPLIDVPAVIDGARRHTSRTIDSVDPGARDRVVARSAACGANEADEAVAACLRAWDGWRRTPAGERAVVLFGAAEWMRIRRNDLAALEVFEAGKPWAEADADVTEAIDFCEYYGREMLRLDQGGVVQSPPGERNVLRYQARGVGAVIAPWNFPLAIPTGMVTAALVAGNAVCFKPAEQTPAIALRLVEALEAGGLPPGVLAFLPGYGEEVGARLVEHPDVAFITFTGSKAVGLAINEDAARHRPGQRHVKRVVAEMGGKNALVVDADADLDQAVPAIVASAFGFAGQKCSAASRLVVVGSVHDELVDRLVGATRLARIGHPSDMGVEIGPVIDSDAFDRITAMIARAPSQGQVLLQRDDVPAGGWYIGPAIVAGVGLDAELAREEVFGPVLTVFEAGDFDEAIAIANATDYALTAGIFSRSPVNIERAGEQLRAGNVYINRGITGAAVGRQPFGGYGLSGVGSKAGGPDYLLQFLEPRVVTENTLRQGFAPDEAGDED